MKEKIFLFALSCLLLTGCRTSPASGLDEELAEVVPEASSEEPTPPEEPQPQEEGTLCPIFTLHEDDTMDKYIPSSRTSWAWNGGYASILYPLVRSLGITACLSMEGQRVGFTDDVPTLNKNGQIVKYLQDNYGWEVMAHSMTARYVNSVYGVESLSSALAQEILAHSYYYGEGSMMTTCVYDFETQKNYYANEAKTGWEELPAMYVRPYYMDYYTEQVKAYNPTFPVDYQWGRFVELAEQFGFDIHSAVMPATTGSHVLCPLIAKYVPNMFEVSQPLSCCNVPPLTSCVNRKSLENGSETNPDKAYNVDVFRQWKELVDETLEQKGWVVFYFHSYRPCWSNSIASELVSNGGTYPDEWVHPITDEDELPEAFDTPPARLGISSWTEWYPCPGTRLRMLYDLVRYAQERGLKNVNSKEGFSMFGNKVSEGFFAKGSQTGQDIFGIEGTSPDYPHRVVGVDGSVDVYK